MTQRNTTSRDLTLLLAAVATLVSAAAHAQVGHHIAVSGNTAIVGAPWSDDAGSAYVFVRNERGANNWGEAIKLTASDAADGDVFGGSVSISGDVAIVGASGNDDCFPGDCHNDAGAAYIFERNQGGAGAWGEVAKITAPGAAWEQDYFGHTVSISGNTAFVGAWSLGPYGFDGSVYVFERNRGGADNWGQVANLTTSDPPSWNNGFGGSISISGDMAVVGAAGIRHAGNDSGAAYIFDRNQGGINNWGEVKRLTASDAAADDRFSVSVSISGETAIVGASGNDDSGSAYIFERNRGGANNWGEAIKLTASDAADGDLFGNAVSISGDTAMVGAPFNDDAGETSGSAYIFDRNHGGVNNWGEVTKLTASNAAKYDYFGSAVSNSGEVALVGGFDFAVAYDNGDDEDYSDPVYIYTPEPAAVTLGFLGLALLAAGRRTAYARPIVRVR